MQGQIVIDFASFYEHGSSAEGTSAGSVQTQGPLADFNCHCEICDKDPFLVRERVKWDNKKDNGEFDSLNYQILPPRALGYWLSRKRWIELNIHQVADAPAKFSAKSFAMLQMSEKRKKLIRSVVSNHQKTGTALLQDLNKDKGNGLVLLLHGKAPSKGPHRL